MKIFIIEDNLINQRVLTLILNKLGYTDITITDNGPEALKKLKDSNYDLVFLDISLPIMDGYECLKQIKSNFKIPYIVGLTANRYNTNRDYNIKQGMYEFITKPYNVSSIKNLLSNINGN